MKLLPTEIQLHLAETSNYVRFTGQLTLVWSDDIVNLNVIWGRHCKTVRSLSCQVSVNELITPYRLRYFLLLYSFSKILLLYHNFEQQSVSMNNLSTKAISVTSPALPTLGAPRSRDCTDCRVSNPVWKSSALIKILLFSKISSSTQPISSLL